MPTRLKTDMNIKVYTFGEIDTLITYLLLLDRRRFIKLVTRPARVSNLCYSEPVIRPLHGSVTETSRFLLLRVISDLWWRNSLLLKWPFWSVCHFDDNFLAWLSKPSSHWNDCLGIQMIISVTKWPVTHLSPSNDQMTSKRAWQLIKMKVESRSNTICHF
jgi:hypothetical protein